ncbi:hypothetical protein LDENG_00286170, partial [Lucifuga dentata]
DVNSVSFHYHSVHPYIRYTSKYIRNPDDQSVTFRCLECPVEFVTLAGLKAHYRENHSEAPDVFTMHSHELSLGFKCFLCSFTTNIFKALKEHHQKKHPDHNVTNSLMYCRYSMGKCQDGTSQLDKCEDTSHPETSGGISPKSFLTPCKEVKNTPSPQTPTLKGVDVASYRCNNCKFSHHSVVVMHVHYQKCHPEETVTIDKIKQSTHVISPTKLQVTPEKIPSSVTIMDKSQDSPQKNISNSSRKKTSLRHSEHRKTPPFHSETSEVKNMTSTEVTSKRKKSCTETERKLSSGADTLFLNSQVFYCLFCSYSSHSIKSVIGHHNAKHSEMALINTEGILKHSADVQNKKLQSKAEISVSSTSLDSSTCKQGEVCFDKEESQCEDEDVGNTPAPGSNPYGRAEDLFFCQKCNFGNPTVNGVLHHQAKMHRNLHSNISCVVRYTAFVRENIVKSKSQLSNSSASNGLPLPIVNSGDELKFFCHFCNFRQNTVGQILAHYSKKHHGFEVKAEKVHAYTSMAHKQIRKSHLKPTADEEVKHETVGKRKEKTQTNKPGKFSVSLSSSVGASQNRSLPCQKCQYSTQHVYLLKRHSHKVHRTNCTTQDVLQMCFRRGLLQTGYHCVLCVFSHREAAVVYQHYQEKHPARNASFKYVITQLYAGPKESIHKKKKPHIECTADTDDRSPSQPSEQNESKTYTCRACSFKGSTLQSITNHYRAVHPWAVKEDGSVLDVITSSQVESHTKLCDSFDSCQVPVEFAAYVSSREAAASSALHKCRYCFAGFHTLHGLITHFGLKHPEAQTEISEDQTVEMDTEVNGIYLHVYMCPHCTYVNTSHHGVLTHCQMMHPNLTGRPGKLEMKEVQLLGGDEYVKKAPNHELKRSGYMCQICPAVLESLKEMQNHCERDHDLTVPNMLKSDPKHAGVMEKQLSRHNTHNSLMQAAFIKKRKYAVSRCLYCKYICRTKIALSQHMRIHHKTASKVEDQEGRHKCVLCSYSSVRLRYLRSHYTQKHGKTECLRDDVLPCQQMDKNTKSTSLKCTATQQSENTPETGHPSTPEVKNKKVIYKCPRCTYVNTSHHGTLTHCQMVHPAFRARADELQTEKVPLPNMVGDFKEKSGKFIFGGYMCKLCPLIHGSLKKMKTHCEQDHGQTVPNILKPSLKHSAVLKKQLLSKYCSARSSVLHGAYFKSKKYAKNQCQYCEYIGPTKIALSRHILIRHKNVSGAGDQNHMYKCVLCSYSSPKRKYLGTHYTVKHGKAASLKYYIPLCQQDLKEQKLMSLGSPLIQQPENTLETCQPGTLTARKKERPYDCLVCNYSATCRKYLSGHYKRVHRLDACHPIRLQQAKQWKADKDSNLHEAESMDSDDVKCKKCPDLFFKSSQLLSAHYSNFHSSDFKLDFKVLSRTSKKGSEAYECGHCGIKIKGTRRLCYHLNHHREMNARKADAARLKAPLLAEKTLEAKCIKLTWHDKLHKFETVNQPARWNVTEVDASPSSPSKSTETEKPELKSGKDGHTCKHCVRTFMSLTGLRVHERSHAAMDALKKLDMLRTPSSKHIFNKYIIHKSGVIKRFRCAICPYRTNIMGLLKSHLVKHHGEIIMNSAELIHQEEESIQRAEEEESTCSTEEMNGLTEPDEESERKSSSCFINMKLGSLHLEPPDVQRQLNHYSLMAQTSVSAEATPEEINLPEDDLFHCELCNFITGHLSSIRRHYLNRHGKRLFRCKDCRFFTGFRKNFEMHVERGHSNFKSKPTNQKDHCCPFCLYQTKNKNNMIDHVVLHREERVVPIEVRRPKLSRYLEGVIFRCHKCTFTSASAENLRLHMMRHDDIKPYKCRLCYFDCTKLRDLEAHLCDKHQVMRNHELVGQVSLDQLEERLYGMVEDEEALSKLGQHTETEDAETDIIIQWQEGEVENTTEKSNKEEEGLKVKNEPSGLDDVSHLAQAKNLEKNDTVEKISEQYKKQGEVCQEENVESNAKSSAPVLQCENSVKPNSVVQQKQEQNVHSQAENDVLLGDTVKGHGLENAGEQTFGEGDKADKNQAQVEIAEKISTEYGKMAKTPQAHELYERAAQNQKIKIEQNIETKVEDDILCHILLLDEEGSITSPSKKWFEVKTEVMPTTVKKNHMLTKTIRAQEYFTGEREKLAATHNREQIQINHKRHDKESMAVPMTNCKVGHMHKENNNEEIADPYGEMPVLENEYLKEEVHPTGWCKKEGANENEVKQERADETVYKHKNHCKDQECEERERIKEAELSFAPKGAFITLDGAAEILHQPISDEKLFSCELCGRSLMNSAELERHIMRHGM